MAGNSFTKVGRLHNLLCYNERVRSRARTTSAQDSPAACVVPFCSRIKLAIPPRLDGPRKNRSETTFISGKNRRPGRNAPRTRSIFLPLELTT